MVGNVELRQGANRLSGGRMLIDLNSGRATVDGRGAARGPDGHVVPGQTGDGDWFTRSEEHTSELQSLMRISYAVFCLKKKKIHQLPTIYHTPLIPISSS